jgi:hypothetical protein
MISRGWDTYVGRTGSRHLEPTRLDRARHDVGVMTSAAADAARDVSFVLPELKSGSLHMFGDWFGRAHDNWHHAVSVSHRNDDLLIEFNEGEDLTITEPAARELSAVEFRVQSASRVVWDVDWYSPEFNSDLSAPAAELL